MRGGALGWPFEKTIKFGYCKIIDLLGNVMRALSYFLALCLCVGLSVAATAQGDMRDAYKAKKDGDIQKALDIALPLCDAGDGKACWFAGDLPRIGYEDYGVKTERSNGFYLKACDLNIPEGCYNYARGLTSNRYKTDEEKETKARKYYGLACVADVPGACNNLAVMQMIGMGGEKDLAGARSNYKKGCDEPKGGLPCVNYGEMLETGKGGDVDLSGARKAFKRSCEKYYFSKRCYKYAASLTDERAGKTDFAKAEKMFIRDCDLFMGGACHGYGLLLESGQGVARDMASALTYFEKACNNSFPEGCYDYGRLMESGNAGPINYDKVKDSYERACNKFVAKGCYAGGQLVRNVNLNPDDSAAFRDYHAKVFFQKACDLEMAEGCLELPEAN